MKSRCRDSLSLGQIIVRCLHATRLIIRISLVFSFSLFSCTEKVSLPKDLEKRGIRSNPPISLRLSLDLDRSLTLEGLELSEKGLEKHLTSVYRRTGSSLVIVLTVDKDFMLKNLNHVFIAAASSKIKNFAIQVEEKGGFKNYRHFQIMSRQEKAKKQKEPGDIYFTESLMTIQEVVSVISSKKDELSNFNYYSYYVIYDAKQK